MSANAGQVDLDLVLQSADFQRQMRSAVNSATRGITGSTGSIASACGKITKLIAGAFAVKQIVAFGKACLNLGSDLAEVQNVVDVTFTTMSDKVNEFAKSAMTSAGLSETVAKRYTGTFGAMAKSFGFTEKQAADMSMQLTQLSGDVASFYNISTDEAYTKLKSVFTGETESLKELGVVMTQNALDAYAMANGYGKTTAQMSEFEKVSLRQAFVMEKLSAAQGDFSRTSDSWANQIRVLKLRFDALRASIGQGLISVLTPVVKMLNLLLAKLQVVADAFSKFITSLTGKKSGQQSTITGQMANDLVGASDAMGGVADAGDSAAGSTKDANKAAKELKRTLSGIDEINTLQAPDSGSGSDGSGGGVGGGDTSAIAPSTTIADAGNLDEVGGKLDGLISKLKEYAAAFKDGFKMSFNMGNFDALKQNIKDLGKNLKDIFTSPEVLTAADNFAKNFSRALGQIVGGAADIGVSIGNALVGGLNKYLQQSKDFIKKSLARILDVGADLASLFGNMGTAIAKIFSSIGSEAGQKLLGGIMGCFGNAGLGMIETFAKTVLSVLTVVFQPIIDNADKIKTVFENMFNVLSPIFIGIAQGIADFYTALSALYENVLKPIISAVTEFLSGTLGVFLDWLNSVLEPLGGLSNALSGVWRIVGFFIGGITSVIAVLAGFKAALFVITGVVGTITKAVGLLSAAFTFICSPIGIVTVVVGALIAAGVLLYKNWDTIKAKARELSAAIVSFFQGIPAWWEGIWTSVENFFTVVWERIKTAAFTMLTCIKDGFTLAWQAIVNTTKEIWTNITTFITTTWNNLKNFAKQTWESIKKTAVSTWTGIRDSINERVNHLANNAKTKFNQIYTNVCTKWESIRQKTASTWDNVRVKVVGAAETCRERAVSAFQTMIRGIQETCANVAQSVYSGFQSAISYLTSLPSQAWQWGCDFVQGFANGIISAMSSLINTVASMASTVASYLHFSCPDVGPLSNYETWMPDFMQGLAKGIESSKGVVLSAVKGLSDDMTISPTALTPALQTVTGASMGTQVKQAAASSGSDGAMSGIQQALTQISALLQQQGYTKDTPNVAVYIGEQQLDAMVVSAQNRRNLRSGGRG